MAEKFWARSLESPPNVWLSSKILPSSLKWQFDWAAKWTIGYAEPRTWTLNTKGAECMQGLAEVSKGRSGLWHQARRTCTILDHLNLWKHFKEQKPCKKTSKAWKSLLSRPPSPMWSCVIRPIIVFAAQIASRARSATTKTFLSDCQGIVLIENWRQFPTLLSGSIQAPSIHKEKSTKSQKSSWKL